MKKPAVFLGMITAGWLLSGGISFAQQSIGLDRLDRLFEQIDLDASGTLTVQEMRAAAAARFNALDMNGDGTVSRQERNESGSQRLSIGFKRADTDGNGTLDIHEMQEVAKQRTHRRMGRLDTDGDGMLSLQEVKRGQVPYSAGSGAAGPDSMTLPMLDAQMMALFQRADLDGNGIVTWHEAQSGANR